MKREPNGDPRLTENGLRQAELFGEYWSKILQKKAAGGHLHVLVSPMTRNLQTADPFMRNINDFMSRPDGSGTTARKRSPVKVSAVLNTDLFEIPGLFHPEDAGPFLRIQAKLSQDDQPAEKSERSHSWRHAGLTGEQIHSGYPWCSIPPGKLEPRNRGWYRGGCESRDDIIARIVRLADLIEEMRNRLSEKDVVVIFTHGLTHNMLMNLLLARQFFKSTDSNSDNSEAKHADASALLAAENTGSVFNHGWLGLHPGSNTSTSCFSWNAGGKVQLHFIHRLDHLGPETEPDTLMRGYQYLGLANLEGQCKSRHNLVGYWGLKGGPEAKL